MPNAQINPLLIQRLLGQDARKFDGFPSVGMLPGTYAKRILRNKKSLTPIIEENYQMLTCRSCGRKGKYDVGMLTVSPDKKSKTGGTSENIQMTGYFRCKHCNDAGNWELPMGIQMQAIMSMLPLGEGIIKKRGVVGKNLLFDGSWHLYTTDAEEHLLSLLNDDPNNSYIWNRLGNLYHKGNRPELAACAFEHSLMIDSGQTESHFTLGDMLAQISDLPKAGYHLRQMLLSAEAYKKMPAEKLREMLAVGLQLLFLMADHTDGEVPFLPTSTELAASGRNPESTLNLTELEIDIFPDKVDSFYPLAEMYMGIR